MALVHAAEFATPVPAVGRSSFVFVRLLAAQEMERVSTLSQRLLDRMGDDDRAGALELERGIEAGQVGVSFLVVREAVINGRDIRADAEHVKAEQACGLQRRRGL